MTLINPLGLPPDLYLILADDLRSLPGFGIRMHTHGNYSHSMEMITSGMVATQGFWTYKEIPIERYMRPHMRLKFFRLDAGPGEFEQYYKLVESALAEPGYKRRYDYTGIIGQLIPGRWNRALNDPGAYYCSERSAYYLREIGLAGIPRWPNPAELNKIYEAHDKIRYVGHWIGD